MKVLKGLYWLVFGAFLFAYLYMFVKTYSEGHYYLTHAAIFGSVWLLICILLSLNSSRNSEVKGRIIRSLVYALIIWGLASWAVFDEVTESYGTLIPLILLFVTFGVAYWLNINVLSAHLFLVAFCLSLVWVLYQTEGNNMYRVVYTFGPEGARHAISYIWFVLFITYCAQQIFVKIKKGRFKPMQSPRVYQSQDKSPKTVSRPTAEDIGKRNAAQIKEIQLSQLNAGIRPKKTMSKAEKLKKYSKHFNEDKK